MGNDALSDLLQRTVEALDAAGVSQEALATVKTSRFTPVKLVRSGSAWRLGGLLLDREGHLFETGELTRAVEPPRGFANKSPDAETRREWRRAALRGKFAPGEAVNFRHTPIDVAAGTGVALIVEGTPMVRWNHHGNPTPLDDYLAQRLQLLVEG